MSTIDSLLKQISKTQDLTEIENLLRDSENNSDDAFQTRLLILILRALTDKGFKTYASMLSQEYFNREDLDGAGEIYGVDFYFKNPPPMLEHIKPEPDAEEREWKDIR